MSPIIHETDQGPFELTCDRGTMRLILMSALADANLWTRAVGASAETKGHWARRATLIRGLLEQLPPPANPRDPYEDLPGEPTPEEAEARWRERAAAEDARSAARRIEESKDPDATREIIRVEQGLPTLAALHAADPDLAAALALDAEKLTALGADAGPTLDDIEDLLAI